MSTAPAPAEEMAQRPVIVVVANSDNNKTAPSSPQQQPQPRPKETNDSFVDGPCKIVALPPSSDGQSSTPGATSSSSASNGHIRGASSIEDGMSDEIHSDSSFPDTAKAMSIQEQGLRAFAFTIASLLLMCFVENIVTNRMPDPKTNPPLPDLMYELLPRLDIAHVTDIIVWISNISVIAVCLITFPYRQYRAAVELAKRGIGSGTFLGSIFDRYDHLPGDGVIYAEYLTKHRNLAFRAIVRYAQAYALGALMRCVSMLLTSLPTPPNDCLVPPHIDDPIGNAFIGLLSFGGANKHCGDLLFSGHTLVIVLNATALVWYGAPLVHRVFNPFAGLLVASGAFTILSSRSHYSIDVFYATVCAATIFSLLPEHIAPWLRPILTPFQIRRPLALD